MRLVAPDPVAGLKGHHKCLKCSSAPVHCSAETVYENPYLSEEQPKTFTAMSASIR